MDEDEAVSTSLCNDCGAEFKVFGIDEFEAEQIQFCPYCGAASIVARHDYESGDWIDHGDDEEWEN